MLDRDRHLGGSPERRDSRDQFEQDHAQRIEVTPGVGLVALDLFGAEVFRGSEDHSRLGQLESQALGRLGDAEISHLDEGDAIGLGVADQYVARLDVAVDQARGVGVGQGVGDLHADLHAHEDGQRPVVGGERREGLAPDELHDDVGGALRGDPGVEGGDHVGMGQPGRGHRLAPEALQEQLVLGQVGVEHLHRHRSGQHVVVGLPDRRHSSLSDQLDQPVAAGEHGAGANRLGRVGSGHGITGYRPPRDPLRHHWTLVNGRQPADATDFLREVGYPAEEVPLYHRWTESVGDGTRLTYTGQGALLDGLDTAAS